jgi:hypothetical protein
MKEENSRVYNYDEQVHLTNFHFLDFSEKIVSEVRSGEEFSLELNVVTERVIDKPILTFAISTADGYLVNETYVHIHKNLVPSSERQIIRIVKELYLRPGTLVFFRIRLVKGTIRTRLNGMKRNISWQKCLATERSRRGLLLSTKVIITG